MKKYGVTIALLCASYTIHTAEKKISERNEQNAFTTSSSLTFQEWPAQDYAKGNKMQVTAFSKFLEDNNIDYKNKKVLSIGCGTGETEAILARTAQYVYGIDASKNMVEYAKRTHIWVPTNKDVIKVDNLKFLTCAAENFKTNEKFDLAISAFAFHWFSDKQKALHNIADSLKSGSLFFANIPTADNPAPIDLIVVQEMIRDIPIIGTYLANCDNPIGSSYPTCNDLKDMLTHAGFEIIKMEAQSFTWNPTREQYSQRQKPVADSRPGILYLPTFAKEYLFNELISRCLAKLPQNQDGTYKDVYTGTIVLARKK